ncbi:hypothetical protein AWB81_06038 [Caballeronia arationis]|uniref:methyltransferase domain-containing protein n=1 Tax=Caballeronia arationis TaxID=1777142 RepID=UPI00074C0456|nr:methyltransferase domain-containing protein [Caballeronia arationis]SAL01397.1 hypothetical protein AWB81_06038 [Caballeronia arationis]
MSFPRIVTSEILDELSEEDPAAQGSRRDLQRVHRVMGTRAIVGRALETLLASRPARAPLRILELGAGDGTLMLSVAQKLKLCLSNVELTLLDRQDLIRRETIERYARLGWRVQGCKKDIFDWRRENSRDQPVCMGDRWDLIVTTLFLHHFEASQLVALLDVIAASTERFFACEPRRDWLALLGSHLIGALGVNAVTRHDAVLSVHAGFREQELQSLWPAHGIQWQLDEFQAGLFSHCFRADRVGEK